MRYYHGFNLAGVANDRQYEGGIQSTKAKPKHVIGVYLEVDDYQDNDVEVYLDREQISDIKDYCLQTHGDTGGTNTPYSTTKILRLDFGITLDIGSTFEVAVNCGGNTTDVRGAYIYDV